ncbi:hypothetical protein [Prosthecobacter sp.]|uniref:hypothetical protein n=1 Tax=Prosthecobacter sp. TaxID=1965333 RepID=UPI003784A06C
MKTLPPPSLSHLLGLFAVLAFSSCSENEEHVQETRQLREKLAAAEKKLAGLAQQPAPSPAPVPSNVETPANDETAQKLEKAQQRIIELEKDLEEQRARLAQPNTPAMAIGSADSLGLLVKAMENDLLNRVGELRQSLGNAISPAHLLDTKLKRLRPLDKIAAAYDSAITFKVSDKFGNTRNLVFPVQPGADGLWHLPTVATVQQQINAFINNEWTQPGATSHGGPHMTSPLPLPPGYGKAPEVKQAPTPENQIIHWDTPPKSETSPASAPVAVAPVPAPVPAPAPAEVAAPRDSPRTTPAPRAESPRVPAPVMPVLKDFQVRFE